MTHISSLNLVLYLLLLYSTDMTNEEPGTTLEDLVTTAEAAEMAGVQRRTWSSYVARDQAPKPTHNLDGKPFWDRAEVEAWVAARPRANN